VDSPKLPGTAAALAGVCTFLGAGVLIVIAWKFYTWRKRKQTTQSNQHGLWSPVSNHTLETDSDFSGVRPRKLVLKPTVPQSPSVMWQPARISPWLDPNLPRRPPTVLTRSSLSTNSTYVDEKGNIVLAEGGEVDRRQSPPLQSFTTTPSSTIPMSQRPASQHSTQSQQDNASYNTLSVSKSDIHLETPCSPQRAESLAGRQAALQPTSVALPRLVTVAQTFPKTLHDELEVKVGDTLRLLQEFKDGWTLCQRVGPADAEKGAVPSCCIAERPIVLVDRTKTATSLMRPVHKQSASTPQVPSAEKLSGAGSKQPVRRTTSFLIGVSHRPHHQQPRAMRL